MKESPPKQPWCLQTELTFWHFANTVLFPLAKMSIHYTWNISTFLCISTCLMNWQKCYCKQQQQQRFTSVLLRWHWQGYSVQNVVWYSFDIEIICGINGAKSKYECQIHHSMSKDDSTQVHRVIHSQAFQQEQWFAIHFHLFESQKRQCVERKTNNYNTKSNKTTLLQVCFPWFDKLKILCAQISYQSIHLLFSVCLICCHNFCCIFHFVHLRFFPSSSSSFAAKSVQVTTQVPERDKTGMIPFFSDDILFMQWELGRSKSPCGARFEVAWPHVREIFMVVLHQYTYRQKVQLAFGSMHHRAGTQRFFCHKWQRLWMFIFFDAHADWKKLAGICFCTMSCYKIFWTGVPLCFRSFVWYLFKNTQTVQKNGPSGFWLCADLWCGPQSCFATSDRDFDASSSLMYTQVERMADVSSQLLPTCTCARENSENSPRMNRNPWQHVSSTVQKYLETRAPSELQAMKTLAVMGSDLMTNCHRVCQFSSSGQWVWALGWISHWSAVWPGVVFLPSHAPEPSEHLCFENCVTVCLSPMAASIADWQHNSAMCVSLT